MVRTVTAAGIVAAMLAVAALPLAAQTIAQAPVPPDEIVTEPPLPESSAPDAAADPRTMTGRWEFSNADREKTCTIQFRSGPGRAGRRVTFDPACATHFPFVREIVGWELAENDFLRLLDGRGATVLEFSEVESGIFEAPRPGEGILFIQSAATAAPDAAQRAGASKSVAEIAGEWSLVRRAGRALCTLTLSQTAVGDAFAVRVGAPCAAPVARFAPAIWRLDRGEIVLQPTAGATAGSSPSWRFEAVEEGRWRRVPEAADPLFLVRK